MPRTTKTYPAADLLAMQRVTTHPGEMLSEEFLKPLNMSARSLAEALDIPANRLTEMVAGRRGMTADTALRLSRYFATTPEFWMNLQSMFDLTTAVAAKRKTYAKIAARKVA